jgi:glutamate-ammonia-ligase adenylyltransferase
MSASGHLNPGLPPESLDEARPVLARLNIRDSERGWHNWRQIQMALGEDASRRLWGHLVRELPVSPAPDMALNNLERLLASSAGRERIGQLLQGRDEAFRTVFQLLGTSQYAADLLALQPELFGMLSGPRERNPGRERLVSELRLEVQAAADDAAVVRAFRRFRQRQILRIGHNDIIRDRPLEEITRDISEVADAALEVAFESACARVSARFGRPYTTGGAPARATIFAFGKLGGGELNYSSDVDLMFIYDQEGSTRQGPASITNEEFFGRVASEVVRLLSVHTDDGQAYRTDLRLRPEGQRGALARSLVSTLSYYDSLGRTWERQALIKLRPVAGDLELGRAFLNAIEPFVYRKYLSFAEINEIKVLKRKIEVRSGRLTNEDDVKTGHGGIRDIEFSIQFLQLLNGGDLASVRQPNTLRALAALAETGCLTDQEFQILDDGYRYLRKLEHRLQFLFDLQTHRLPQGEEERTKLARRMGYEDEALASFLRDYRLKTGLNRKILDHLLHETFQSESGDIEPESDLILDPSPDSETIKRVLGRYPFRDAALAFQHLSQLANESAPFLSARRCRHFFASIAPRLLRALAQTPDPDLALVNLEQVTASLGAKAVLWELFSFNPPSLKLYVDICAYSPFLSSILIHNPGMSDELLDSLVLNQPRTLRELKDELSELVRGAVELRPILRSFQDKEFLRIGVRDILGKDTVYETTLALSDLAEAILERIILSDQFALTSRWGVPTIGRDKRPCGFAVAALGKLGGRELGYHSDLDLMLVYEEDGFTVPGSQTEIQPTDNFHYFSELAQRIIKSAGVSEPMGRLYVIDMRLRPTGKSGSLVIPLAEFRRYFAEGEAGLWERQALTRARIVYATQGFAPAVEQALLAAAYGEPWKPSLAEGIRAMRERLEQTRGDRDLKRGFGGIADIEFIVQLFLLKYARERSSLRTGNVWIALARLEAEQLLPPEEAGELRRAYDFLRLIEGRLRVFHNRSIDEIPEREQDVEALARRLGFSGPSAKASFLQELDRITGRTRELFLRLVNQESQSRH